MSVKALLKCFRASRLYYFAIFGLLLVLLCTGEFLYSNRLRHETDGYTRTELSFSDAMLRGEAKRDQQNLIVKDGSTVLFPNAGEEVINVAITLHSRSLQGIKITVSSTDDANKETYRTYVDGYAYTDQTNYFRLRSFGNMRYLRFQFQGGEDVSVSSIVLNDLPPLSFNFLRVALIFFVIVGFWAIFRFRLWLRAYDSSSYKHRMVLFIIVVFCVLAFCIGGLGTAGLYRLPLKEDVTLNAYEQLFFALQKGQLELDVEHDKELYQSLENPYDYTERKNALEAQGLSVFGDTWDRAYYNGEFYCYFGIAPVILFFFPIYFLTGYLPNTPLVVLLVSIIGALALFGALIKMISYFRIRVPLLMLCFGYPVLLYCAKKTESKIDSVFSLAAFKILSLTFVVFNYIFVWVWFGTLYASCTWISVSF